MEDIGKNIDAAIDRVTTTKTTAEVTQFEQLLLKGAREVKKHPCHAILLTLNVVAAIYAIDHIRLEKNADKYYDLGQESELRERNFPLQYVTEYTHSLGEFLDNEPIILDIRGHKIYVFDKYEPYNERQLQDYLNSIAEPDLENILGLIGESYEGQDEEKVNLYLRLKGVQVEDVADMNGYEITSVRFKNSLK